MRALCLFSAAFCFIVQQSQKACDMFNSSTNGKDITKTCTGNVKAGGLVVKAWDNPPAPPLLLQAAVDRHHRQHPRHKKETQGARNHPRARVGQAVRDRPGHLRRLLRCAASYFPSETSKTMYRRPPPKTFKCRVPLKELDHLAVT